MTKVKLQEELIGPKQADSVFFEPPEWGTAIAGMPLYNGAAGRESKEVGQRFLADAFTMLKL